MGVCNFPKRQSALNILLDLKSQNNKKFGALICWLNPDTTQNPSSSSWIQFHVLEDLCIYWDPILRKAQSLTFQKCAFTSHLIYDARSFYAKCFPRKSSPSICKEYFGVLPDWCLFVFKAFSCFCRTLPLGSRWINRDQITFASVRTISPARHFSIQTDQHFPWNLGEAILYQKCIL